jgi:uncharacterized protein (PEP-CTERM system associated)
MNLSAVGNTGLGARVSRVAVGALLWALLPSPGAQVLPGVSTLPGAGGFSQGSGGPIGISAPRTGDQGWVTEASVTGAVKATNNSNYGLGAGPREPDLILQFIPALRFNRSGGRLRVDGYVALDMVGYVNDTQVSSILPKANIIANLEAIDNVFFIDGALVVGQFVENPFLPSSASGSTNNLYTSTQARLAPYLQGNIGPNVRWLIRSDNSYTWTSQSDDPLGNQYFAQNTAQIERVPTPFGVTLRLQNDITRVQNQVQPDQELNTALAIFNYAFTPQLTLGLRGGYETTNYTTSETAGPIYGANIAWFPSPITSLVGFWEERFYGPSYQVVASHRQRRVASSFAAYRTVSTYPQVLFQLPSTTSTAGLLNAILVARIPDPVDRANAVNDLITRQGLPSSLPGGVYIYNNSANILTGGNLNSALIGVRNTVALNFWYLKTESLPDARVPPSLLLINNNIQRGASISASHTLTPVVSLNASLSTQLTKGYGPTEGLNTRENTASLQANWTMSPRTTMFMGTQYQFQTATNISLPGAEASQFLVFAGLFHRL